jgi:lysophospholipase L1-like esterase
VKIALLALGIAIVLLVLVEVGLRWRFGFGNPPRYVADAQMGYRLAPNQRVTRFRNRIEINQYSMRGAAIAPKPPANTLRVLMLGDSIINGGWWTDQDQILSALVQRRLQPQWSDQTVEVLNASANSWGPRNELAYLLRYGTFEAKVVLLVLNTDDLFAARPNSIVVGRDRSYPTQRPPLALVEALRYVRPAKTIPELDAINQEPGDRVGVNLEAIRQIHKQVTAADAQLILAMTPLLRELPPGEPRDYEQVARQRLLSFTQQLGLTYLDFLAPFSQASDPSQLYRDHIHLSPSGNDRVADALTQALQLALTQPEGEQPPISRGSDEADDLSKDLWGSNS